MQPSTTPAPGYWLGTSATEIEHLAAQAEVYAAEAAELLDLIGPAAGMSAIDVGCGVLGILPLLAERVGAGGRVVGLDLEPRLLAAARGLIAARDLVVETVQADAADTGLPSASFDLVHARTLLLNVVDPRAVVAELHRLARPGGTVALQEPDLTTWCCDPPHPAFEGLREALIALYVRSGKDHAAGRHAARMLRDAGLADVQVRVTARVTRPGDYYHTFLLTLSGLLREALVRELSLDADGLDAQRAALREHLSRPDSITCQPLLWQAWGVRRAHSRSLP